ncbi:MAG TPA: lipopolysaccharide heptosyltransferase II [Gemmatimonadales bacterium]|nr:lipopolysaccharide heptosyltransferase II [Gemmatimonadales bacterium]
MAYSIFLSPDVLVLRFSAIGDIILMTPLLRAIRTRYPGARITVLTKRQYTPLVSDNPNVNEVFGVAPTDGVRDIVKQIRSVHYTHLLDLQGGLRTAPIRLLARGPWSSYSNQRGARELLIRTKRNAYPEYVPVAERYFEAARDLGVEPDGAPPEFFLNPGEEDRAAAWLAQAGIGGERPMVSIAPGAAHATKRWPRDYWVQLIRSIVHTGADVVIVGGPDDSATGTDLAVRAGSRVASAAGDLSLQGTGAVIKRSAALISGDTGVMHMATGLDTPVVALFGPTVRQFGFFPYKARATVVERDLGCRPCSSHGGPACPLEHHRCMREIQPEMVFTALTRALA